MMEDVPIMTRDGYTLSSHLFLPKKSNGKLVLINSATGVKQQFYFSIARFFAENGFVVMTYDYRGIGLSKPSCMRNFKASMRDWGSLDYAAVTGYILKNFRELKKFAIGHSVGALLLGMNEDSRIFERFVFVSTQNSYYKRLNSKTKLKAFLGLGVALPIGNAFFGYFPAHFFGVGESLPKGCAKDWRTMILHPKSVNKLLESQENYSGGLTQKVLFLHPEDDFWITVKGMETLMTETYPKMNVSYCSIPVSDSEQGQIGHVNFFRSFNKNLWEIPLNWINADK